ncbi:hypothetical protein E4631_20240 [Hymenobacter sp. UV11]|uniref:heavy metal-binding domain-containing protein n=1 Tax=Hymenobacter sp. UV11 TaxID=1849735 RepID=UPI00106076E8|nr:heavy metal-binding domain-containing protein [Hymenobacter sp. UV11]TDN36915.1 hypothetical protein A8B98_05830 [Hymenobacter sp. UV11]TFZ64329.1 hypothetical protein E4631_20240 [Hymenobacter sp. UV11]
MKSILLHGFALASLLLATGCSDKGSATTDTTTSTSPAQPAPTDADSQVIEAKAAQYSCPMHPNEVSDHPGKCPKCGMALVKKS